ncbi:unnamed protein product [Paramecium pentaurelia]|uniref:ABC transporter domain-containing protein n=1 Tax=Paramecium pentaurelia TaxID=43138 RepID=A0A8S1VTL2_9CILI|nr:unnamed protein product [Paramecium pentaurelia]
MSSKQIKAMIIKNFKISFRNGELYQDIVIPVFVACMLSLKEQLSALNQILPLLYSFAVLPTARSIMVHLVEEKSKKYKELQGIMGLNQSAYKIGWLLTGYLRMTLALIAFFLFQIIFNSLIQLDWDFYYINSFTQLMWPYIVYGYASINQSFLFASVMNESRIAGEVATFFCVGFSFFIFLTFIEQAATSILFYILVGLMSPQCNIGFEYITALQVGVNRVGASVAWFDPILKQPMNIFPVILINETYDLQASGYQLIVTLFLYLFLALYFDQVIPNEYGISQHPLFLLGINYKENVKNGECLLSERQKDATSAHYYENIREHLEPSIYVDNLTKSFNNKKVVNNLTLRLYEKQIFCLLGHNGAGKTTTISMLTGLINKSKGKIQMYDMNFDTQLKDIRKHIGLCTQQDCLYEYLTVREHLNFFAEIKQSNKSEIDDILEKTELKNEMNQIVQTLSKGSQRKLSLAISLIGNSKIIFLDEPTSGMDAFSRRQIWNILQKIKQEERTIILTTHHLDEAEILADRIGIMQRGELLAEGSCDFIKKTFGEGYTLNLRKESIKYQDVSEILTKGKIIPEQCHKSQLTFQISFEHQDKLETICEKLENQGIEIDLRLNTLEEAFVKIGEHEQLELSQSNTRKSMSLQIIENTDEGYQQFIENVPMSVRDKPIYSLWNQCLAMFQRRFYTTIRTNTNILAFFMPLLTILLGLLVAKFVQFSGRLSRNDEAQLFLKISILACVGVVGFTFNSTLYVTLPVLEKECQLKEVMICSGCRIFGYWLGTFLFDFIVYSIIIVFFLIMGAILSLEAITSFWWQTVLIYLCFGLSYITCIYLCSFLFDNVAKAMKLFVFYSFFYGFCLPMVLLGLTNFLYHLDSIYFFEILVYTFQVIFMITYPFYNYYFAYACMPHLTKGLKAELGGLHLITYESYWYVIMLIYQFFQYSLLIYYLERRKIQRNFKFNPDITDNNLEDDVYQEQQKVLNGSNDIIQAIQVFKKYQNQQQFALNNISFGLKEGEIMGIIGPNGAGKSTLINVLTNISQSTYGMVKIQYADQLHVGICPQYDCIWENLTVKEHLHVFSKLRGLSGQNQQEAVTYYLQNAELYNFRNTRAGQLSGGNKRKLCVALALIGGSDIIFFDEPTTGVDPISRRTLFKTLKQNVSIRNCSVVITTHTIEEAENLSDTLGILIGGQFICYGEPNYLKEKYSDGYYISILHSEQYEDKEILEMLKKQLNNINQIKEVRKNYLTINIKIISFHSTFKLLNQLKQQKIIQEFSISKSSLENIFVLFTKQQNEINDQLGVKVE